MGAVVTHRVVAGERWDHLAARYYGDALAYEGIIRANPDVPINAFPPPGTVLDIPVLDAPPRSDPRSLPPWKR